MATGTYDESEVLTIHRMRGAIGDRGELVIDPETELETVVFLVSDELYQSRLDMTGDWRLGAASVADTLYREFSQRPDSISESGEVAVSWRTRAEGFRVLADRLRAAYAQQNVSSGRGFRTRTMVRADREPSPYEYRPGDYEQHGGIYFDD